MLAGDFETNGVFSRDRGKDSNAKCGHCHGKVIFKSNDLGKFCFFGELVFELGNDGTGVNGGYGAMDAKAGKFLLEEFTEALVFSGMGFGGGGMGLSEEGKRRKMGRDGG